MAGWASSFRRYYHNSSSQLAWLSRIVDRSERSSNVDTSTLSSLLWTCLNNQSLHHGKRVHALVKTKGGDIEEAFGRLLVQMYLKCGSLSDAKNLVQGMCLGDVVTWTRMIAAYAHNGHMQLAVQAYHEMLLAGVVPNKITIVTLLNGCIEQGYDTLNICRGQIPANIREMGFISDTVVATVLLNLHSRFGRIQEARHAFDTITGHDAVSWNSMMWVYAHKGLSGEAMSVFSHMQLHGIVPNKVSFLAAFSAAAACADSAKARGLHKLMMMEGGSELVDLSTMNSIIDMYAKCGCSNDADAVFSSMTEVDVISWTAVISAYVQVGDVEAAMHAFRGMQQQGIAPNKVTFLTVMDFEEMRMSALDARRIYSHIVESRLERDIVVATAVVSMFGNCGCVSEACGAFARAEERDAVLWSMLIAAYARNGRHKEAVNTFREMQLGGFVPSKASFIFVLDAIGRLQMARDGRRIHGIIADEDLEASDHVILGNAIINMYLRCGEISAAYKWFQEMRVHDESSWNTVMPSLGPQQVLVMFQEMQQCGFCPDRITFLALVNACACISSVSTARKVHEQVIEAGFEGDSSIANALVDMYTKCGSIEEAKSVFAQHKLEEQCDIVSWNALIVGKTRHGSNEESMGLFMRMQQQGLAPTNVSFVGLLSSLSQAGLVEQGCRTFGCMASDYGIEPTDEHRGCVVDLLSRAGWLVEAEEFMLVYGDDDRGVGWLTLLGASNLHRDVERGKRAAQRLLHLQPENSAAHIILSNLCAATAPVD